MSVAHALQTAIDSVPSGAWAVAVSGGADSVALLRLAAHRSDLRLKVIHLNHQTRGAESDSDAEFVRQLAQAVAADAIVATRDEVERMPRASELPANRSARFRRLRIELFARVVNDHGLRGVLVAHHREDQAETVLQRLLRGSGYAGLAGMSADSIFGGVRVVRPLLNVPRASLRAYLNQIAQRWREDTSNESDDFLRNRLRRVLAERAEWVDALVALAVSCRALRDWVRQTAPDLGEPFHAARLAQLPHILARESAGRWLINHGATPDDVTPDVVLRFVRMADDAASPARMQFPGGVTVSRKAGRIEASS
jgi:tRNA(Ile)-lysidine synthetase-like protein